MTKRLLVDMASRYYKTPAQVAINWVINKPNVVTLVKCSKSEHMKENLGAIGWQLDEKDVQLLDENFPREETADGPRK